MLNRREILKTALVNPWWAGEPYAQATRGLPPLRIREVKVIATSPRPHYSWVFAKVITSEPGLYGLGSANNGYQSWAVKAAIEKHLGPFWVGKDPDRIEDLWQWTHVRSYWRNGTITNVAQAALDMALWDIKGKRGQPACLSASGWKSQRRGAPLRPRQRRHPRGLRGKRTGLHGAGLSAHSRSNGPEAAMAEAVLCRRERGADPRAASGARPLTRNSTWRQSPRCLSRYGDKLGWQVKLLHDVHEHLTPTLALEFARRMEPLRMFFVEDILPPEQIDYFRQIRALTSTPMAMGELFTHPHEWRPLIAERLIDFIRCRVSAIGGITQAKKIAALCEQFGVRTAWQEGGENDPVNQLAAYHVDLTIPSFGIQEDNLFPEEVHELMPGTARIRGGYLYGSEGPGLGIDIDEAMASRYPLVDDHRNADWTTVRGMDGSLVKP